VFIAFASSNALAEDKKKVPPKPKIDTSKTLEDNEQLLQFEIQSATSDQQQAKPKPDKLGNFEIHDLMQN
jgi:hypothetical protein